MLKTVAGIAKQEGVLKLWTGLMPMFQRHAIYSGCRLIFYEKFRDAFKDDNGKVSLGVASLAMDGLMPMFQRHAIYSGCRLIFYEKFRDAFKDDNGKVSLGVASLGEFSSYGRSDADVPAHAIYSGCRLIFYEKFRDAFKDDNG
ncbi:putative mitochondrial brown fat uncoupling protein, partial [Operophtera brumata]